MITIVDYGVGNTGSILNILKKVGARATVTANPKEVLKASKLLLPGVGAFDPAVTRLHELGLADCIKEAVGNGAPILGICLGMQVLTNGSEEGTKAGLGLVNASVKKFGFTDNSLKVPHMGWNGVKVLSPHDLMLGLGEDARFYFVHSYFVTCAEDSDQLGITRYGHDFTSVFARGHVMGAQFHPEKSHRFGMKLLENFSRMRS